MKKFLVAAAAFLSFSAVFAQDTTWVQTFTFDTIVSRRANFQFPASLNDKRFEKVLMYYKLRCSPLTTWDQYDCGEWDYLTYTRVFDHTGVYDSVQVDGSRYKLNTQTPATVSYNTAASLDQQWKTVQNRAPLAATPYAIAGTAASPLAFVHPGTNGQTLQWIIDADELLAAGVTAGDIQGLELSFLDNISMLQNVRVRMKQVSASTLTGWETTGLTTVFDNQLPAIVMGASALHFATPFVWDGTSNIVVELSYADANAFASAAQLEMNDNSAAQSASAYDGHNGVFRTTATNYAEVNLSNIDLGGDVSIAFWAKGNGSFGTNTSILEAVDSLGNRILNIHMPWSDGSIYFDAGSNGGYDRINKVTNATDIDNNWHHWAFVKKTSTGQMFIFKDGVQWHTGSNLNRPIGKIDRFFFGTGADLNNHYKGDVDEFSVWTTALDAATIAAWKDRKIDATHPAYANLEVYYDFDNVAALDDKSGNNRLGMCSEDNMVQWSQYPVAGRVSSSVRPKVRVITGSFDAAETDSVVVAVFPKPKVLFEYEPSDNSFHIINNTIVYTKTTQDTLNLNGTVASSENVTLANTATNTTLTYFQAPFEIVHDVEIGRYITPYGIGFDLGPQGFTWIYDVTDYQKYLHDMVDLAAHNTQELIDLKFAFIEGTPPRDVHDIAPIWSNFRSYNYAQMANDEVLSEVPVILSDTSEMFKIKTRFSGHGQVGNAACCEWAPKDHQIYIDGVPRFTWNIWRGTECGENPNIRQGGTWPYAREGWCPGDLVPEYDHEITSYVTPGDTVQIDYDINDVPANDPGQAGGNYIVAMDLVSYSAPNFQHDGAIVDVLNPNKYEYYNKWNPTCSNPRVIIQNTGAQAMTSCKIRCWVTYGNWLEYTWTGNLGFLEKEIVEIPITDQEWWFGTDSVKEFTAQIYDINGANLDEYAQNNVFKTKYQAPELVEGQFYVFFNTNNRANENSWKLIDGNGATIFERTTLQNSTQYRDTFDLAPGCYSIILEDTDHDGIGFWYSSQVEGETSGQFRLRLVGGGYFETFPTDFGKYHRYDFSVGFTLNTDDKGELDAQLELFPNPATDQIRVEFNGNIGKQIDVQVLDANGRVLKTVSAESDGMFFGTDIPLHDLAKGTYFIKAIGQQAVKTSQFIKQ